MQHPELKDFLSPHTSDEKVVDIQIEPQPVYLEDGREDNYLNFDFVIEGLTDKKLILKFIKVAVYDSDNNLLTYRYLNHNAVGTPGIFTVGKINVDGKEKIDLPNPFYRFSKKLKIGELRYMFTFFEKESKTEYYYGNIIVKPMVYQQQTELHIPLKGLMTIMDGHDYYSHHRRFEMTLVRQFTQNQFTSNFSRFGLDFTLIGPDGNLSNVSKEDQPRHYDFHFDDARNFFTHGVPVYAPAAGIVVDVVNDLDDLYNTAFNMDQAVQDQEVKTLAGNYVIIKHTSKEFSHLYHLLKGSISVKVGDNVLAGQAIGKIGFSGAATTYVHLHYNLMNGKNFLQDEALPCKFSDVTLLEYGELKNYQETTIDTGDFILNERII